MWRLTDKSWRNLDPWECCGQNEFCTRGCHDLGGCRHGCIVPKLYNHLAAYEDTGLTPEEITAMRHTLDEYHKIADPLLRAQADGRVVVLPCKVGGGTP